MQTQRERAPDPVFDISPCSVDKGCHPLVLRALTAVSSHHPSPAQETIDQPDSSTLACVCVIVDMCVSFAVRWVKICVCVCVCVVVVFLFVFFLGGVHCLILQSLFE